MFTGLIEQCVMLVKCQPQAQALRITIDSQFSDLQLGESIAVNGICLTVADIAAQQFSCDISPETLAVTNAAEWSVGTMVNLERALTLSTRLGGHFVAGHVDAVATVADLQTIDDYLQVTLQGPFSDNKKYCVPKGSITVNGVSLTINAILDNAITLLLIPHTLQKTNLAQLRIGQLVNIEFDLLAKLVAQQLTQHLPADHTLAE